VPHWPGLLPTRVFRSHWLQGPAVFAGQFAAVAYITGLQLGEPIPVEKVVTNAGLEMKVRPSPGILSTRPVARGRRRPDEHALA